MQNHTDIKKSILSKISPSDYMHMAYLRPIQLVLKPTDNIDGKKQLPNGLLYVNRASCEENQEKHPTQEFNLSDLEKRLNKAEKQVDDSSIRYNMAQDNLDNLLFHMMLYRQIQMCICICMYNESKDMLDNTLYGVGQNIHQLATKYNVNPDKIAVIILADGMGKISPSIVDWSQMMLKQSGMFLSDDIPEQKLQQIKEEIQNNRTNIFEDGDEGQMNNYNLIIFDPNERQMRKKERFSVKKKQYDEVVKLLDQATKMLQEKITPPYQRLPARAKDIFASEARKEFKNQNGQNFEEVHKNKSIEEYAEKNYLSNKSIGPNLIRNTLTQTKLFCHRFINSRDPISHVSFYRTSYYFPKQLIESRQSTDELVQQKENERIKMNIFFCAKYKNAQKLSSHSWFFNGFCRELNPKYSILLDVGLRPEKSSLCKMYIALSNDQNLGGVCGYMGLKIQKADPIEADFLTQIMHYFVDIQRAQQMEYHFAHIIDKPFQSWFNFIHVLPGAFSGYSMKAIWGKGKGNNNLLTQYFKSINDKMDQTKANKDSDFSALQVLLRTILPNFISDCFYEAKQNTQQRLMYDQNVYLAQDRILCMKIHKSHFKLQYLPDAFASVDPMKSLQDLLGQRKRWINGSFFAFSKVKKQLNQKDQDGQNKKCCQDIGLKFQTYYLSFMNVLGFVAPALFLFTVYIAMQAFRYDILVSFLQNLISPDSEIYNCFVLTMNFIYVMLIGGLILYFLTLTNKNEKAVSYVYGVSTIMGILSIIVFVVLFVDLIRGLSGTSSFLITNSKFTKEIPGGQSTIDILRYIILFIIGLYTLPVVLSSILFRRASILFQVVIGVLSFVFYNPTYVSILNIYALCRMDDLSWGTKGLQTAGGSKNQDIEQFWKTIKIIHVAKFVFWNVVVGGLLLHFGDDFVIRFWITFVIMLLIASTMTIKVVIAIMYYIQYYCCTQTKTLKFGVANSQTLYERFERVKKHYTQSISENIDGLIDNMQKAGTKIPINQNNLLNSHVSRIYMNKKKQEKMEAKNQIRKQKSKILKFQQVEKIKNNKYIQPKQKMNQSAELTYSPQKQSQNSEQALLNGKKNKMVQEEMVFQVNIKQKQKQKQKPKPKPNTSLLAFKK